MPLHREPVFRVGSVVVAFHFAMSHSVHVEHGFGKGVVHLVAHLKVALRNAWSDDCLELRGVGMVSCAHIGDSLQHNASRCASPSGVYGAYSMMSLVVEQNGYTVGSAYAYAHAREVGHHGVDALKQHAAYVVRQSDKLFGNDACVNTMRLMRHNDVLRRQSEFVGKQLSVLSDVLRVVATPLVNIERGVSALPHPAMAGGGEGHYAVSYIIICGSETTLRHRSPPLHIQSRRGRQRPRCPRRRCI